MITAPAKFLVLSDEYATDFLKTQNWELFYPMLLIRVSPEKFVCCG